MENLGGEYDDFLQIKKLDQRTLYFFSLQVSTTIFSCREIESTQHKNWPSQFLYFFQNNKVQH